MISLLFVFEVIYFFISKELNVEKAHSYIINVSNILYQKIK